MENKNARFTYGDKLRRKRGDGSVLTIVGMGTRTYQFSDGTFALISDQDCYDIVERATGFFLVSTNSENAPLDKYMLHGYEERQPFKSALDKLVKRWGGRAGKNMEERNGFLRLRFYDNPGGITEDAWLPDYLLTPTSVPSYLVSHDPTQDEKTEAELDEAFGFD